VKVFGLANSSSLATRGRFKTWEGEISQGMSGSNFSFSVMDKDKQVITDLQEKEGQYVKLSYIERYKTFPWWGDTKYFVIAVKKTNLHLNLNKHEQAIQDSCLFKYYHFRINVALAY
jgi:hypothetical protein